MPVTDDSYLLELEKILAVAKAEDRKLTNSEALRIEALFEADLAKSRTEWAERDKQWEELNKDFAKKCGHRIGEGDRAPMYLIDYIPVPEGLLPRQLVRPEKFLELYQEGLSLDEIAKVLERSKLTVIRGLRKFGIQFTKNGATRISQKDIPFGWSERKGKLEIHPGEQWILEKIDSDRSNGKTFEKIAEELNSAQIKPRLASQWLPQMVKMASARNKRLRTIFRK